MNMEMELSLEHLNPDLVDLKCSIELDLYQGTTEGLCSEDPSEVHIISITVMEDRQYEENGVLFSVREGDQLDSWDKKMENQIMDHLDYHYAQN